MVEIDHKIVMTGIICLTTIFVFMLIYKKDNEVLTTLIIGIIALCIGVILPSPKLDNKRGVLKW